MLIPKLLNRPQKPPAAMVNRRAVSQCENFLAGAFAQAGCIRFAT
jgi:hypothetical protein